MLKKISIFVLCLILPMAMSFDGAYAAKSSKSKAGKQSAIQKGTNVRTKMEAKGIYDQECYEQYFGCMDQFCITDNMDGGSCACSDAGPKYAQQLSEIQDILDEAERIRTVEVDKVKAGAKADIIFNGERQYDENGNIVGVEGTKKDKKRAELLSLFDGGGASSDDDEELDLSMKNGAELFSAAEEVCLDQISEDCDPDLNYLHQLYLRQIVSDCEGMKNAIAKNKAAAELELANAKGDLRDALKDSFNSANKYDLGQCMVEFKKCMQTEDACGKDWINCVSTIASENMQNNTVKKVAGTKVATVDKYDITASTQEILNNKRIICEHVLDECVVVRDMVWPAFLREAAPTLKVAESRAESKMRQSCLTDISKCIQTACKDDIVGKGEATMDACLARPDMARSFCKVEIDKCERMEPQIFEYVKDKLAAMRVDACTEEVRECYTDEMRCGKDFTKCIGMDYDYMHDMCPIDKLVVCKQGRSNFSMSDLDSMLMGFYLNLDNAAVENCQNIVDKKMAEVCGSTTDCNKFAADDMMGTGSLRSQKVGNIYRVTGMISFGSIKMGDAVKSVHDGDNGRALNPGEIGVADYLAHLNKKNTSNSDKAIISNIEEELNNIAGTINRTIQMIEQDPEVQFCVKGRNLSQITGKEGDQTQARFPNLLNGLKMQIAVAALRQAQENYNKKLNEKIAEATQNSDVDLAQYMCQKMASDKVDNNSLVGMGTAENLMEPYSISYDVAVGLKMSELLQNGSGSSASSTKNESHSESQKNKSGLTKSKSKNKKKDKSYTGSSVSSYRTAVFSRSTRMCHVCTQTDTSSCDVKGWGRKSNCQVDSSQHCEDIQM